MPVFSNYFPLFNLNPVTLFSINYRKTYELRIKCEIKCNLYKNGQRLKN